ncbi:hypothetical protein SLEP1_g54380 [Rubroshorea leprosula]|uniref:Uncharacterized protein n=1 Tax=Rubroshorea leprosula TaxID=152421 RepID=A0AAV5MDB1_9ROSI|nr:hypothetical protein SLEP1_g54380 [Rubroshorea leprosula]
MIFLNPIINGLEEQLKPQDMNLVLMEIYYSICL